MAEDRLSAWEPLFRYALQAIDSVGNAVFMPASWSFGGGTVLGREVRVETSAEIVAKKVRYRAADFTARDVLDLALVAERAPEAMIEIAPLLREKRHDILQRLSSGDRALRKTFAELEVLEYRRTYDQCVRIVRRVLKQA